MNNVEPGNIELQKVDLEPIELANDFKYLRVDSLTLGLVGSGPDDERLILSVFENQVEPFAPPAGEDGIRYVRRALATLSIHPSCARSLLNMLTIAVTDIERRSAGAPAADASKNV